MISKNRQLNGDSVIPAWSADLYTVIPAGSARIQMPWKGSHIPVAWIPALPAGTTTFSQFNGSELTGIVMEKQPCVYLLASRRNGTLYMGVTSDLIKRVYQHRNGLGDGFTKR
ncbi:MAG: GIY-YIG nuclease family protein, partial [Methylobacter sp.]